MKTYDELTNNILEKTKKEKIRRGKIRKRIIALTLVLTLMIGGVSAVMIMNRRPTSPEKSVIQNETALTPTQTYNDIYKKLSISKDRYKNKSSGAKAGASPDMAVEYEAAEDIEQYYAGSVTNDSGPSLYDGSGHSETNVQVKGIDEADYVKTDGERIYAVSHRYVYIYSADKGNMELLAKVPYLNEDNSVVTKENDVRRLFGNDNVSGLYFTENRLIVVLQAYEKMPSDTDTDEYYAEDRVYLYSGYSRSYQCAAVYDISDLSGVTLLSTVAVSGSGVSSRMTNGRLYVVAEDSYYGNINKDDPATFIPGICVDGEVDLVKADSVYCGEGKSDCKYLNVIELDTAQASVVSSLSLLGYDGDIMYQSPDNIFVAKTEYDNISYILGGNGIYSEYSSSNTVITKISVAGGLALEGMTTLDGYLNNSFSMDEYEGYLRVVTSVDKNKYTKRISLENVSDGLFDYEAG